jgi:hypothetical protein
MITIVKTNIDNPDFGQFDSKALDQDIIYETGEEPFMHQFNTVNDIKKRCGSLLENNQ